MFYLVCSLIDGTSAIQATLYGIILFCRVFLKGICGCKNEMEIYKEFELLSTKF